MPVVLPDHDDHDDPDDVTEITGFTAERVDAVKNAASGFRFILAKAAADLASTVGDPKVAAASRALEQAAKATTNNTRSTTSTSMEDDEVTDKQVAKMTAAITAAVVAGVAKAVQAAVPDSAPTALTDPQAVYQEAIAKAKAAPHGIDGAVTRQREMQNASVALLGAAMRSGQVHKRSVPATLPRRA